jgi:hypothetical protein
LKKYVNVPSKSNKQKNLFFVGVLTVNDENSTILIQDAEQDSLVRGMDPQQNVMDPQH